MPTFVGHKGGEIANFVDEQLTYLLNKKNGLCRQAFPAKDAAVDGVVQEDTASAVAGLEVGVPRDAGFVDGIGE